ncbi:S-methyl-5'-thioadenosine phosphorylase [Willisornis vidua]|uniref:S-methyl-5'-thioadenosine phosphorylase n=1 Tax=Willisornis vidua TaxID=1566151 RepID=A0ABQ9DRM3_9PASS|nr:S-methyl-5'-thioadenosine phosphorylase [Willisornis vidua]
MPSDALILGKIKNVDCVLLARHGRHHTIMPSNVNYRANIWALKEENCSHVLVTTACGSLREEIQPGDLVIIDQFIDRTTKRHCTLYDGQHSSLSGVCHIPMAEPFCTKTREVLIETAKKLGLQCHSKGTMITIEGPRFSSRAESCMFRLWGADVINMTTVPEVILAKEAGMSYASIAMATDYDCWKEHEEAVSVDKVLKTLKGNANKATSILLTAIPQIGSMEWTNTLHALKKFSSASARSNPNNNANKGPVMISSGLSMISSLGNGYRSLLGGKTLELALLLEEKVLVEYLAAEQDRAGDLHPFKE